MTPIPWPTEAIRTFLLEGHIAGLHLGADASSISASLGEPEEGNVGSGMRRNGLCLRRYLGSLEVTTLDGRIVMLLLHVEHPPCSLEAVQRWLVEAYGVASVREANFVASRRSSRCSGMGRGSGSLR